MCYNQTEGILPDGYLPKGNEIMLLTESAATGNVSANVYMIIFIAAAVVIIAAVIIGIIAKKKK